MAYRTIEARTCRPLRASYQKAPSKFRHIGKTMGAREFVNSGTSDAGRLEKSHVLQAFKGVEIDEWQVASYRKVNLLIVL